MLKVIVLLLSSTLQSHATVPNCPADQVIGKGVVASRFNTVAHGCIVQVTPLQKPELRYRDYWIDERGRLLVFTSVPGDDLDKATGTRTYFLFPRLKIPGFKLGANGDLSLTLATGQEAVFRGTDAQLKSLPGQIGLSWDVSLENQGGLEIDSFNGIRLDAGWKVGTEAYKDPIGSSTLIDAHEQKCTVKNNEFFFYENMYYSEPNQRFPDDPSLAKFLQSRCPNLDVSPLIPPNALSI